MYKRSAGRIFASSFRFPKRPTGILLLAAGGSVVGYSVDSVDKQTTKDAKFDPLALSSYTDPVRHSAIATARSSRFLTCALLCFNDYRTALKGDEKAVSDCHWKCAKRVLKVLETNGGIYSGCSSSARWLRC